MSTAYSQNNIHYLENSDSVPDCAFLRSGVFLNEESQDKFTDGYSIEFNNGTVIEKIANGQYFVKSKIVYDSECSYILTVIETTYPSDAIEVGLKTYTEILDTAVSENLILIRSKAKDEEWQMLVFKKISSN